MSLRKKKISPQALQETVSSNIEKRELISQQLYHQANEQNYTLGERIADRVAEFGGSWAFISWFAGVLFLWILINALFLGSKAFDPYPFILLNLVLSCLAAIQAPVIMMSQNRKEAKDRQRAQDDYMVNLKAEIEIQNLHHKIDELRQQHLELLATQQREQTEILRVLKEKIAP